MKNWSRNPELILSELLKNSAQDKFINRFENIRIFSRALVLCVDVEGGKLQNQNADSGVTHEIDDKSVYFKAIHGVENPKNSIKAKILTDSQDRNKPVAANTVFWPIFPEHMCPPIKPGEHVYVLFEDKDRQHGLWFCKVSGHENINYYDGADSFVTKNENNLSSKFNINKENFVESKDSLNDFALTSNSKKAFGV